MTRPRPALSWIKSAMRLRSRTAPANRRFGAACALALLPSLFPFLPASAAAEPPPRWHPDIPAARAYAATRAGDISFAVRTEARLYGHRTKRGVPAASVLKAMLMAAYLNHPRVRGRPLARRDRRLLSPMIRRSDNASASRIRDYVGARGLNRVARRAGMRRFRAVLRPWGHSRVNAADQTRLFLRYDRYVVPRHRAIALRLLETIVPAQRWGVARVRPRGWRLHFKGGWGSGSGAVDHQVALLRRGRQRVAVAVMTTSPSHAYGKQTLHGVFERLLRGLEHVH